MYSYARIKKIKDDLLTLLSNMKTDPKYSHILNAGELSGFESALTDYDVVLIKIGPGGYCKDEKINSGFNITEQFISKIHSEMDAIKRNM